MWGVAQGSHFELSDFLEAELTGVSPVLTVHLTRNDADEHPNHEAPNEMDGPHVDRHADGGSAGTRKSVRRSNLASRYRGDGVSVDCDCGDFYRLDARCRPVRPQQARIAAPATGSVLSLA